MSLRAAYWAMHRRTNAVLAKQGLSAEQLVLMSLLFDEDAMTQQELVVRASSDANTVRSMLILLQKQGLLERKPHATDGRALSVALTVKGRRTFKKLRATTDACRRELVSAVGSDDLEKLIEDLRKISEAMFLADGRRRKRASKAGAASYNRFAKKAPTQITTQAIVGFRSAKPDN